MSFLCVKNWHDHQHYRDRTPLWIKLHKRLLDDYEFHCLPIASKALAPMIWLLASEYPDGKIPLDEKKIAFRLHMTIAALNDALKSLIDAGFLYLEQSASGLLAEPEPAASLEKEIEIEIQVETDIVAIAPGDGGFEDWYGKYPRKVGRAQACKAFKAALKKANLETLTAGLERYRAEVAGKEPGFIAHPATWLNGERWLDEPGTNVAPVKTSGHATAPPANGGGIADSVLAAADVRKRRAAAIKDGDPKGGTSFVIPKPELQKMMAEGLLTMADMERVGLAG